MPPRGFVIMSAFKFQMIVPFTIVWNISKCNWMHQSLELYYCIFIISLSLSLCIDCKALNSVESLIIGKPQYLSKFLFCHYCHSALALGGLSVIAMSKLPMTFPYPKSNTKKKQTLSQVYLYIQITPMLGKTNDIVIHHLPMSGGHGHHLQGVTSMLPLISPTNP